MSTPLNLTNATARPELTPDDKLFILNLRLVVYGYIVLPLALIGLALNSFTILVLMHPKMRYFSTNAYLTTLSLANIICLILFVVMYSLRYLLAYDLFKVNLNVPTTKATLHYDHSYENFILFIYGVVHPIFTTFQLYSIYLTCAVTVDRWIYVTFPLKVDTICSMRNTFTAIAAIFAFCFIYNFPRWFEINSVKQTIFNNSTNSTISYYQVQMTAVGRHAAFDMIMRRYGYIIFVYGLPFLILLVVNIGIVKKLIETKRRKRDLLSGAMSTTAATNPLLLEAAAATAASNGSASSPYSHHHNNNHHHSSNGRHSTNGLSAADSHHHGGGGGGLARGKSTSVSKKSMSVLRSSLASSINIDPRITLMVMAIVLVFFLCQFPYLIINILFTRNSNTLGFNIAKVGCDLLTVINYCLNFLIYCFFGQNFRELAHFMICYPSLHPYNQTKLMRVLAAKRKSAQLGTATTGVSVYARNSSVVANNNNHLVNLQKSTSRVDVSHT